MTDISGIRRSVNYAWTLLNRTGVMDSSRAMHTEYWRRNKSGAVRELRQSARALVRRNNQDAYGELSSALQQTLWKSILASQTPAIGRYIMSRLGGQYRDMADHLRTADSTMSSRSNGFSVHVLHRITARILDANPTQEVIVEQQAARDGDPMPRMISAEEGELYNRIILRAITLSNRERSSNRNAGEAALGAFAGTFLPSVSPTDRAISHIQDKGLVVIMGETAASRAGSLFSIVSTIRTTLNAHTRQNDREASINHWIDEVCLTESRGDSVAAMALRRRLHRISQALNAWLAWLERHQDHPSYVPPGGVIEEAPHASLRTPHHNRPGSNSRRGSVRGSVRSHGIRGTTGLA